jgi:hypothetical protein
VLPGAFVGVGMAVLYNGAIQTSLRESVGSAGAVAAVTALAGVSFVEIRFGRATAALAVAGGTTVVVAGAVLAVFLATRGVRAIERSRDVTVPIIAAAGGAAGLVALALLAAVLAGWASPSVLPAGLSFTVAAAAASVGYERARSVWVPALAFASYLVLADATVAIPLAGALP